MLQLAPSAHSLGLSPVPTEKRKLLDMLLSHCTSEVGKLHSDHKEPFCWWAEGSPCTVWRAIRDDFADFLRSAECLDLARRIT